MITTFTWDTVLIINSGLRCTSTGRKCDGYELAPKDRHSGRTTTISSPHPDSSTELELQVAEQEAPTPEVFIVAITAQPSSIFEGSVQEKRAFHRFKQRTVPAFSGGSETEFWTDLVLRTAISEPVIRKAVIALGTLHEGYELSGGRPTRAALTSTPYKDAALLYGLAIRHLYQKIDANSGSTANLAVIASILFACFELLRRNTMAAVMHYQNGMRQLLKTIGERDQSLQLEGSCSSKGKSSTAVVRATPHDDLDRMLRVFARYDIQACTFQKPKVEALRVELQAVPRTDIGLSEVRRYLDNLLIAVYQLVKSDLSMFRYWKTADVSLAWLDTRNQAIETFQRWLEALEKSIPSDAITLRNHGITASKSILGLVLQVKVAMILLRTSIDCGPESTFDQFIEEFEEIVSRVEDLTNSINTKPAGESLPFIMELGVIHPLFFVASKCRDWQMRRRAIAMLRKCGKEGVWEGPIMAVVAERILHHEEHGLEYGAHIPELARIHDIRKTIDYENGVVRAEMRKAQDLEWKNWSVIRDTIPFQ